MGLKRDLRRCLWGLGWDLVRYAPNSHHLARRRQILESAGTEVVLDVGANTGQYAIEIRSIGFHGRIVSFEPLSSAFSELRRNALADDRWDALNFALGRVNGSAEINIAGNSLSSSLLEMLPVHVDAAPESGYVDRETIEVRTLDSLMGELCADCGSIWLKVDAQGFERDVIEGARESLARIDVVQVEMSLVHLYRGDALYDEMSRLLAGHGYALVGIEPTFCEETTGRMLQLDGIFRRP